MDKTKTDQIRNRARMQDKQQPLAKSDQRALRGEHSDHNYCQDDRNENCAPYLVFFSLLTINLF